MDYLNAGNKINRYLEPGNKQHAFGKRCVDCISYQKGFPCFHRAAARIIRLYMEAEEAKKETPALTYLPVTVPNPRRLKIGGVWID